MMVGPCRTFLHFTISLHTDRQLLFAMRKGNSSRNSTQETSTSSEATARGSSHRPRGRVGRFLQKVKDGANKLRVSRSKDSRSHSPAPPNVLLQCAPLTPNINE
ncbi:hypothetical protein DFJ58DRAFT_740600, partial [Suillus subalutaceus]|uniref:uncharacterized protein n=1 Tax=Suillus subalutaceus TaxID=48586 RepID=UPI001B85CA2E